MEVNQWTRTHNDQCEYDKRANNNERPLRYVTYDPIPEGQVNVLDPQVLGTSFGGIRHVNQNFIDQSNDLRPQLSNKNDINQLESRVFSTVPYMGTGELIGHGAYADMNSSLRSDATRNLHAEEKVLVSYHTPHYLHNDPQVGSVLPDEFTLGGRSSRNDMRELYTSMCPRK